MIKAYEDLVQYALADGCNVSVWDGEEWAVSQSENPRVILDSIESVEEAWILIRKNGEHIARAVVSAFGLEPEETVIDQSINAWMDGWAVQYDRLVFGR